MIKNLSFLIVALMLLSVTSFAQSSKYVQHNMDKAPRVVTGLDDQPSFYTDFKTRQLAINRLQGVAGAPTDLIVENYDWFSNSYMPHYMVAYDFTGDGIVDPFAITTGNTLLNAGGTAERYSVVGFIDDFGVSTYLPYGLNTSGFPFRTGWNSHLILDDASGKVYLAIYDFLRTPSAIRDFVYEVDLNVDPTVVTKLTTEAGALAGGWARFALDGNGTFWELADARSGAVITPRNIAFSTDNGATFTYVDSVGSTDPTFFGSDFGNDPLIMASGDKISIMLTAKKAGSLALLGYGTAGTTNPDSASGLYYWSSIDGGNSWTGEWILREGDPQITNRPTYEPLFENYDVESQYVDPTGVTHQVMSGVNSVGLVGSDTVNVYPLLYWNDRDRDWMSLELPAVESAAYTSALTWGNVIGAGRPFVKTDATGNVVVVLWSRAQFEGAPGASTINTYVAPPNTSYYNYDVVYAYSKDKGVTWSAPAILERRLGSSYVYPTIGAVQVIGDSAFVHYAYYWDKIPGSFVLSQNPVSTDNVLRYNTVSFPYTPVSVENENVTVNSFSLDQNYPNPFNPSTTIKYSVAERSNVSIKIYDVLGKEVANLVNTVKEVGSHEVNFNASNLASGMYIYSIKAGNFTSSKKMMLMK